MKKGEVLKMKNKPYREINTWKRHNVEVLFINGEGVDEQVLDHKQFLELNSLKKMKMIILFDGIRVYESKQGVFGIKEFSYRLLKRKGILLRTVNNTVDVLTWEDEQEYELFVKWANHFRISQKIQELVKLKFVETYSVEVQSEKVQRPEILKYIQI